MRNLLLLASAVPLLAPPALAGDDAQKDSCRLLDIDHSYSTEATQVHVKLVRPRSTRCSWSRPR
jgi:hypothetical protein